MKKQLMITFLAMVVVMTACGSSEKSVSDSENKTETDTESAAAAETEAETGTEYLEMETETEDAEPDNWMDYVPEEEESSEEQQYEAISDQLEYEALELETGLAIHVKNSAEPADVQTDIGIQFYDASGNETWYGVAEFNSLPVGEEMYVPIMMEDTYSTYDINIDTSKAYMEDITAGCSMETEREGKQITASVRNNGDETAAIISLTTRYYKGDQLVGCTIDYDYEIMAGEGTELEITQPENAENGKSIDYDSYEIDFRAYAQNEEAMDETLDGEDEFLTDEAPASDQTLVNP